MKHQFANLRHCIGRLADHIRAPMQLIGDSRALERIFDNFEVKPTPFIVSVNRPVLKRSLSLNGIVRRMLKEDDKGLEPLQQALNSLDAKLKIFEEVQKRYECKTFVPRVHAEIQVLEHFYDQSLEFAYDDRYIACSKPACYCCRLYFRNHPGRPVEPGTHGKIWLNWGPPRSVCDTKTPAGKHQEAIMNKMLDVIRGDVRRDIENRHPKKEWHADSHTGITESVDIDGCQTDDDISYDGFSSSEEGEYFL